jgi:hypothetical protein
MAEYKTFFRKEMFKISVYRPNGFDLCCSRFCNFCAMHLQFPGIVFGKKTNHFIPSPNVAEDHQTNAKATDASYY